MAEKVPTIANYDLLLTGRELREEPTYYFDLYPLSTIAEACLEALKDKHRITRGKCTCGADHTQWAKDHIVSLLGEQDDGQHPYGAKLLNWFIDSSTSQVEVDTVEFALSFGLKYERVSEVSRAIKKRMGFLVNRHSVYWSAPSMREFLLTSLTMLGDHGTYTEGAWNTAQRAVDWMMREHDARFLPLLRRLRDDHEEGRLCPLDDPLKTKLAMHGALFRTAVRTLEIIGTTHPQAPPSEQ